MKLTETVLKRPVSTLLVVLAIFVFGISSLMSMPLELMNDIDMPMELVYTIYPGAQADDVDELVSKVIEDGVSALSGLTSVTSQSYENYSMVLLQYDYDTKLDDAYLDLRAALDSLKEKLPKDARSPMIMQMSVNSMATMQMSVTCEGTADPLIYISDNVVPALESIPGVARVEVSGGEENFVQVLLHEDRMNQYGLNISTVAQLIGAADFNIPAGSVINGHMDVGVSAVSELNNLEELRNVTLMTGTGALIRLSDIADVSMQTKDPNSLSRYNGTSSITVSVTKKQTAGTTTVCDRVLKTLDAMNKDGVVYDVIYNSADSIHQTMRSVVETLVEGVLFTMLVLYIFIGDIRASLIVGSSMPLSLLATIVILNYTGNSLNILTGGALIIAIGMIVDNSIVVLESCFRLKEVHADFRTAALKGTQTVAASVLASTITTVVVYLPISLISGLSGQLFKQLGFTIIYTMVGSLISALSVVPLFFTKIRPKAKEKLLINRLLERWYVMYDRVIRRLLRHNGAVLAAAVALLVGSIALATQLNVEMMPSSYDGSIAVTAVFRSGTTLESMNEMILPVEQALMADDQFQTVSLSVSGSRATVTAYAGPDTKRSSQDAVAEYTERFSALTNMDLSVKPTANASFSGQLSVSGVEIDLVGTNLDDLRTAASMVETQMRSTRGVIKVSNDFAQSATRMKIHVDPLKAMNVGLTPAGVSMEAYYTLSGVSPATMVLDGEEYDITVQYPKDQYRDVQALMNKPISTPYGTMTTLQDIADFEYTETMQSIVRQDGLYQVSVTASTTGSAFFKVQKSVKAAAADMDFPGDVRLGSNVLQNMQNDELSNLLNAILAAVFLVFLVMAMQFESVRFSLMVMVCIPFSLIGSFTLLFVTNTTLSMVSMMGLLMLMGIVVNNGILLVDTTNQLKETMSLDEALVQAGKIRLRPILMTTLTTVLSMLPMVFANDSNMSMMHGMAWVIIGGLIASTLMALFMMPSFYLLLSSRKTRKSLRAKPESDSGISLR